MQTQRFRKAFPVFIIVLLLASFLASIGFFVEPIQATGFQQIKMVQGPTNPTIVTSDNASYSLMANGTYQAYFKSNSQTQRSVRFQNKGYTFDMDISTSQLHWYNSTYNAIIGMVQEMNPQDTQINASGNTVLYSDAWINTDLMYQTYSDQLKETLIIHNVSAPSSSIKPDYLQYGANCYFNNSLTIYANGIGYLHPTNQKFTTNGTINFNDATNKTVFWLPIPYLYDSNGSSVTGIYAVTANNGILLVNIRVPKVFLDSAVFPVYFDPILRVQGNAKGSAIKNATTCVVTMASIPTSGNTMIMCMDRNTGSTSKASIVNITETGVTWDASPVASQQYDSAANFYGYIYTGAVGAGASKTITIYLNATLENYDVVIADVCEYSGLAASPIDLTAGNSGAVGKTTGTGTTATTTQANELWIGCIPADSASNVAQTTPTNGFTLLDGAVVTTSPAYYETLAFLEKIVSSTGTANSGTSATQNLAWMGCIATFKAANADTTKPTYNGITTNTTKRNTPCNFTVTLADETALANYTFGTNNTGAWTNDSVVTISGLSYVANTTKTLNATVGIVVQWEYWFADSSNNLNNTGVLSNTTTLYADTATLTQAVHPAYSLAGTWSAKALLSQTVTDASNLATQSAFKPSLSQTMLISWSVSDKWTAKAALSQTISTAWSVVAGWTAHAFGFAGSISTSWTAGLQQGFVAAFSQTVTTACSVVDKWNAQAELAQPVTGTWESLSQWAANTQLSNSLTATFSSLGQLNAQTLFTSPITTAWSSLSHWTATVDLSQTVTSSWSVIAIHVLIVDFNQPIITSWLMATAWSSRVGLFQQVHASGIVQLIHMAVYGSGSDEYIVLGLFGMVLVAVPSLAVGLAIRKRKQS